MNRKYQRMEFDIALSEEKQLIPQMLVHCGFNCRRANPNSLPSGKRCQKSQHIPAISPQRHNAAGPCMAFRHRVAKHRTMIDFVSQRFLKKRNNVRTAPSSHPNLRPVNPNGAVLAGVVHL